MTEPTLTERFALLALNAQDRERMTVAKRMALRCVAAGAVLEWQMTQDRAADAPLAPMDESERLYDTVIVSQLAPRADTTALSAAAQAKSMSNKALHAIERAIADNLLAQHFIDIVPSLLGCDAVTRENGVSYTAYRAKADLYTRLTEGLRAEILEDDEMADENVLLFWLLRESGCLHDLFNEGELPTVHVQMQKAYRTSEFAALLLPLSVHKAVENSIKSLLGLRSRAAATDFGIGLNFSFPAFERAQSVFIDTERLYEDNDKFLSILLDRLHEHDVAVLRKGKVPLLRIDNMLYEAVPSAMTIGYQVKVPVYGARLRRYPLFG